MPRKRPCSKSCGCTIVKLGFEKIQAAFDCFLKGAGNCGVVYRWWFQICVMFIPFWGDAPIILFKWVESTSSLCVLSTYFWSRTKEWCWSVERIRRPRTQEDTRDDLHLLILHFSIEKKHIDYILIYIIYIYMWCLEDIGIGYTHVYRVYQYLMTCGHADFIRDLWGSIDIHTIYYTLF